MTRASTLLRAFRIRRRARPSCRLAIDTLEDRATPAALVMSHYNALALAGTTGYVPPDTCGAAGTNRYVETVNQDVLLTTTLGNKLAQDSLSHFFYTVGGLTPTDAGSFQSDPIVTWNDQYQRFIIGDQDVDFGPAHLSHFQLAVSKSASPTTLTAADWSFYSIDTTENGGTSNTTWDADYPGNFGYNHDAFVFTLNMFPLGSQGGRVQVDSVNLADLVGGTLTAYRNDVGGLFSLRPTVMHDSVTPGDPMWLVGVVDGNNISVTKMTNVLTNAASFTTTTLGVNPFTDVFLAPPRNPDGSIITTNIDSRIIKAAEMGGTIVASHAVTDAAGDRVDARWYAINVNGTTPTLADQGSVSAGANTYSFYPGVDINAAGDIGMTFMRSSLTAAGGEFMSAYVTGRQATDPVGTMQTPVLTKAGLADNFDTRAGDLSGINVAPDGTFWAANEFATADHSWGTDIQHFILDGRPVINGDQDAAGENDTILVRIDAANPALLDVYINSATPTYSLPVAALGSLVVNGLGGNDTLTVDYSNGPIPVPINFDGGTGTRDALIVTGYTGGTVRSTYTGPHSGAVGVGASGAITYTNLAPVTLNGVATDLIFNLPAGPNPDATLSDDGGPGDPDATNDAGFSALSGSTFEYTEFANPTGSLTVNLGGSGDTLNLAPMDAGFAPGSVAVNGGAGSDTIVGDNTGRTFTITGPNSGTIGWVVPVAFMSIENLVGGTGYDSFTFATGSSLSGTINGGGGIDTITGGNSGDAFSITGTNSGSIFDPFTTGTTGFSNIENLAGGTGNDSFVFAGGSLSGDIDGGAGINTLSGDNGGRAFTITGLNRGNLSTILGGLFFNIQNLVGGTGNDAFHYAGGLLDGNIDGGAGTDTITGDNAGDSFSITGANAGSINTLLPSGFSNFENLVGGIGNDSFVFAGGSLAGTINGGAGTDTITGDNAGDAFLITGANAGSIAGLLPAGFSNIENLIGGTGSDSFTFAPGGSLFGTINGGAGTDTLDNSALPGSTVTLAAPGSADGFQGSATGLGGPFDNMNGFVTGTIQGFNSPADWIISGTNNGTVTSGGVTVAWSAPSLIGGGQADTFTFVTPGLLTGTIDGGGGSDKITGDNAGRAYTITGANAGSIATLLPGGFSNVENLSGGTGNDSFTFGAAGILAGTINGGVGVDTITGDNAGDAFSVTGANAGSIATLLPGGFSSVENLVGGTGNDSFTFGTIGSLAGTIDGGAGTNTITGNNAGDAFSITGANAGTINTLLPAGFVNVENLVGGTGGDSFTFVTPGSLAGTINGGAGTDTIIGDNAGRSFSITAANAGAISVILTGGFSNVENLVGGTGVDTFQFTTGGSLVGTINGGAGSDTIVGDNTGRNFTLTGANSGTVSTILGGSFSSIENLTGGSGNDTFQFNGGGSLSGNIDGGAGTNTLVGDNTGRTFTITGANAGTVSTILAGTFANIENLTGGSGADTFRFANGGTLAGNISGGAGADNLIADDGGRTFTLTGQDSGTLSTILGGTFSGINLLTGGAGNDTFVFANGGSLVAPGNIDGGAGNDTIVGDNTGRTFTITGPNAGTVSTILGGSFSNVENLTGGSGNDQFTFNGGGTLAGNVDGGGGNNSLTGDNTGRTYTINAPDGGTISVLLGGTFAHVQNLTAGSGGDRFQFVTPGTLAGNIDGGGGTDTLAGDNVGRTFTLTGPNTGTVGVILGGTFANVENLEGGSAGDTLVVLQPGSLTGSFDGKAGTDAVDLSALLTAQALTVTGLGTVDGFNVGGSPVAGGLLNINGLTASAAIGDTLTGLNANTQWTITGVNTGTYEDVTTTRTMPISGFENLSGGSANDLFVFANGGSLTGTVAGNAGTDKVQGDDDGRTFALTGAGSGAVSGILPAGFTGIENLVGGAGADTLTVAAGGSLTGSFDGLGGTDTADLSALVSQQIAVTGLGTTDGFNTTGGTAIAGGLFNLDSLIGSLFGTTDKLTGLDTAGTYTVMAPNAGGYTDNASARTLSFANVENLTGGTAGDTLVVQAAGFLSGAFDGTAGYDTADLSALAAQSPVITSVGATDGYNLTGLAAVGGGLLDLDKVIGSAAATTDNLTGRNVAATWTVTAANAGQYVDVSTRTLDFSNFENLSGGTDNDRLVMEVGGSLAGSFNGGLGTDTGDFSALGAQAFVATTLGSADGFNVTGVPTVAGDLKNVNALVGSTAGTTDSLTGLSTTSTFTVTAANAGSYQDSASTRTLAFTQVENLDGGTANDTLVVGASGSLAGSFDGGAGTDAADLSALTAVQSISILALGGTDGFNTTGGTTVAGGLFDVDKVVGGKAASATLGASDRLTGLNADATWQVKGGADQSFYQDAASGRKLVFANFEELYGGSGKDAMTVDFSAGNPLAITGLTVNGQAGFDSLNTIGAATHNAFTVGVKRFLVNGHVIRYTNMEKLTATGGSANDSFYAPNVSLQSSVSRVEFNGMGGNDVATVSPTVLAVLHLDGGAGTNTLHVLNTGQHYLAPIPPKSAVSGTYFFSNRQRLEFLNFQIRDIGITQPQP